MRQLDKIIVSDTSEALAGTIADWLLKTAQEAIAARGRCTIALSGGHTPELLFALLATEAYASKMPWDKLHFFWGDERYVPITDAQSNEGNAKKLLLDKVPMPTKNYFLIPTNLPPDEAASAYEQSVRSFFKDQEPVFDIIFLGLGENGHTASLFPHTTVLQETQKLVAAVSVEEVKQYRITFTAPLINAARQVAFLLAGESKAEVAKKVWKGPYQPEHYPAQLIAPVNGQLLLFVDKEAVSQLQ